MVLLLLAACKEPVTEVIAAEGGALTLRLVNPTSCSACDPFAGVEQVRIDVVQDGASLASESFTWPAESWSLPDLEGFGVVQVQVRGIGGGAVVSYGQTPPVALGPGLELEVPLVVLPVNVALPITEPMVQGRRRHGSFTLRDGRVLLFGGLDRAGQPTASVEVYDPALGTFADAGFALPAPVAEPTVAEVPTGERFILGGVGAVEGDSEVPRTDVVRFTEEAGEVRSEAPFAVARAGHCTSTVSATQIISFGGHDDVSPQGDFLRYDVDQGLWKMASVMVQDFDDHLVSGCAALADGRTFLQGTTLEATGLWTYTQDTVGVVDPTLAFVGTPVDDPGPAAFVGVGTSIVPLADGDAWVGGGFDPRTGQPGAEARELRATSVRFDPADAQPDARAWGVVRRVDDAGTVVWGCGWRNLGRDQPAASVQRFDVEAGTVEPLIPLSVPRSGCDVAVLPDGTVLVTGGADGPSAEIVRPYAE